MIPKDQLDAWRKLAEEATGSWTYSIGYSDSFHMAAVVHFIATAREAVPALIAEVERLRGSHCKTCHWKPEYADEMCEGIK